MQIAIDYQTIAYYRETIEVPDDFDLTDDRAILSLVSFHDAYELDSSVNEVQVKTEA